MIASNSNEKKNSFAIRSSNILPYAFISSIPDKLNLVTSWEGTKGRTKGYSLGFIFYIYKYSYISDYSGESVHLIPV